MTDPTETLMEILGVAEGPQVWRDEMEAIIAALRAHPAEVIAMLGGEPRGWESPGRPVFVFPEESGE